MAGLGRDTASSTMIDKTCQFCGKRFKIFPAHAREGRGKYCSRKCLGQRPKKPEDHPRWKGGRRVNSNGYVYIRVGVHQEILEHRHVIQEYLGRKLRRDEHVHHKNGVKTDNRLENLEVMLAGDHNRHHKTGKYRGPNRMHAGKLLDSSGDKRRRVHREYMRKYVLTRRRK